MIRYEVLFLTVPTLTSDQAEMIETQCASLIKENKAFLISFERWGKYRLAYPVNQNEYGVYFLVRFEIDAAHKQALLNALHTFFAVKYNELVMRHLVNLLGENGTLEYRRPESLDTIPTASVENRAEKSEAFVEA
jgi:ribosomal protein S6